MAWLASLARSLRAAGLGLEVCFLHVKLLEYLPAFIIAVMSVLTVHVLVRLLEAGRNVQLWLLMLMRMQRWIHLLRNHVRTCAVRQVPVARNIGVAVSVQIGRISWTLHILGCITDLVEGRPIRLAHGVSIHPVMTLLRWSMAWNWTSPGL